MTSTVLALTFESRFAKSNTVVKECHTFPYFAFLLFGSLLYEEGIIVDTTPRSYPP